MARLHVGNHADHRNYFRRSWCPERDRLQAGLMLYTDRRSVTALDHVEALKVLK
ncbi:hypothetical protein [Methanopyrus sp.]